jgi:hypothetical protein
LITQICRGVAFGWCVRYRRENVKVGFRNALENCFGRRVDVRFMCFGDCPKYIVAGLAVHTKTAICFEEKLLNLVDGPEYILAGETIVVHTKTAMKVEVALLGVLKGHVYPVEHLCFGHATVPNLHISQLWEH